MRLRRIFDRYMAGRQCFLKKWWAIIRKSLNTSPELCHFSNKNCLVMLFCFLQNFIIFRKFYHNSESTRRVRLSWFLFFHIYLNNNLPMFFVTFLASSPFWWDYGPPFLIYLISEWLLIEFDLNSYPDKSCKIRLSDYYSNTLCY